MSGDDPAPDVPKPVTVGRLQSGKWPKGVSGNPKGRAQGSRHKATLAVEALLDGEAETITRKAIELAIAGDLTAIRVCLDRTIPVRRDRTIQFELPKLEKPEDAIIAASAITQAVAAGEITPIEAEALSKTIDTFVRAVECRDLAGRIARLETLAEGK